MGLLSLEAGAMPQELAQAFLSAREGLAPPEPLPVPEARLAALAEGAIAVSPLAVEGAVDPQLRARIHSRLQR